MARLPVLPARRILKALQKDGFVVVAQKGSHIRLKKRTKTEVRIVIVPNHKEIAAGTLHSIIRQAGWSKEKLEKMLESS
jgi:predicted RNA binding protein YcfA (HicA-like mRNA interferase family)